MLHITFYQENVMNKIGNLLCGFSFIGMGALYARAAIDHWLPYAIGLVFLLAGMAIIYRAIDRWIDG